MRVTWRGVVALCVVLVPVTVNYVGMYAWFMFAALAVKFALGDVAARPAYTVLRRVNGFICNAFFVLVAAVLELLLGTDITYTVVLPSSPTVTTRRATSDAPSLSRLLAPPSGPGKTKLIIVNHHCRLDWVYLICYYARLSRMSPTLRIVLKDVLRRLPIVGYVMDTFGYLFLSRTWSNDEVYLRAMLCSEDNNFSNSDSTTSTPSMLQPPQTILIFPEGTDLSQANVARSRAFALANGMPQFTHVLNPRTTGLVALTQMLGTDAIESIVDCTIAYTTRVRGRRPNEVSLLDGTHARRVHLLIREWPMQPRTAAAAETCGFCVPRDDTAALAAWVHARFAEKEQLLARLYSDEDSATAEDGFAARDVLAVLQHDKEDMQIVHGSTAKRHTCAARVGGFTRDVGMRHVLCSIAYFVAWPLLELFVASHYLQLRATTLLLFAALTWAFVWWLAHRPHGLQALLYLRHVDARTALLPRAHTYIVRGLAALQQHRRRVPEHDKTE